MRQFVLWLVAVCSAQFNINEILYDSIKGTIGDGFLVTYVLQACTF